MKKSFLKFGAYVASLPVLMTPFAVMAAATDIKPGLNNAKDNLLPVGTAAYGTGGATNDFPRMVGNIISILLGILGIILVIYIVQAGILYMTAAGDDAKLKKAKAMIQQAVVGMVIIVAAYSISTFVVSQLFTALSS